MEGVGVEVGLLACWSENVPLLLLWVNVTSDSSSEVKLYPSSWNRGADECGLEVGDVGEACGVSEVCVDLEVASVL